MLNARGLLLIALVGLGLWLFKRWRQGLPDAVRPHSIKSFEDMVRCAHCGVHVPKNQAVGDSRQGYFCSQQHRLAGPSRHS